MRLENENPCLEKSGSVLQFLQATCDVERLVSAYNLFKDDDRCSLSAETLLMHTFTFTSTIRYEMLF